MVKSINILHGYNNTKNSSDIERYLSDSGGNTYNITHTKTPQSRHYSARRSNFDAVILELSGSGKKGTEAFSQLSGIPVIVISDFEDI